MFPETRPLRFLLPTAILAVALVAIATFADAAGFRLSAWKDDLFDYPALLGTSYGGDYVKVDYVEQRDLYQRDVVPEKQTKAEYVDLEVKAVEKDMTAKEGRVSVRFIATGKVEGGAKIVVMYVHGRRGNRMQGANDWMFGGNFNRIKNLMVRNGGVYLSPGFPSLSSRGVAQAKLLILEYAKNSPGAPIFVACGSLGGRICWGLAEDDEAAAIIDGYLLMGSTNDDGVLQIGSLQAARAGLFRPWHRRHRHQLEVAGSFLQEDQATRSGLSGEVRLVQHRIARNPDPHDRLAADPKLDVAGRRRLIGGSIAPRRGVAVERRIAFRRSRGRCLNFGRPLDDGLSAPYLPMSVSLLRCLLPPMPDPAPANALGNTKPPYATSVALPADLTRREGLVVVAGEGRKLPVDLSACRKILVVRLDFIGDWVLMMPFLANLRASAPEAEITAVVLTRVHDLARSCRFVDRVVAVDAVHSSPVVFFGSDERELAAFVADYEDGAFDLAIVPRWDADFNGALRVADGSGARQVVGFSEACTDLRATRNRGDDRFYDAVLLDRSEAHEVEHKLTLLEAIGGTVTDRSLKLDLDAADRRAGDRFLADQFGGAEGFLGVAPFAVGRKGLPLEIMAELTARLARRHELPVVIVGSPIHHREANEFKALLGMPAVSAVGLPLAESAAVIGRATALVGMDSGPGHIAAALGTPVSVVFSHPASGAPGHVGSPERFRPWGDRSLVQIVQPASPLPPCVDGCEQNEPHCITQLGVDDLFPPISDFLSRFVPDRVEAREARTATSGPVA